MSSIHYDDNAGDNWVFADQTWTQNYESEAAQCSAGGTYRMKATGTFLLPQPLQDPIAVLTGHGRVERFPGTQCVSYNFEKKLERTGD